jgi:hypothetical protein
MRSRPPLVLTLLVVALGALAACSDDDNDDATPASTASTAQSTTAQPVDRCADAAGPLNGATLVTPPNANRECDAAAGWRFFFWIGESGDPIYRVQRLDGGSWVDEGYDVACGLDAATLEALGVPASPAAACGDKYGGQC